LKAHQKLNDLGQSFWLDRITRDLLNSGRLKTAIEEWSVSGLTFNPAAFGDAIKSSTVYDAAIRKKLKMDLMGEELFFELAMEDLCYAADLFRPIYDRTDGVDGWVSLKMSPHITHDPASTLAAAKELYARMQRPNVLIEIPGTRENLFAVEEAVLAGVPVNVTLLFSREHCLAAAEAFLNGIERRISARLRPNVSSVASLAVSHLDAAVIERVPDALRNRLGIAMAQCSYKAWHELLHSPRWGRAYNAGARPQRLLLVDTGTPDFENHKAFYAEALAAPFPVIAMSEDNLEAYADQGDTRVMMPTDGGQCEIELACFTQAGINIDELADQIQKEMAASSVTTWIELWTGIACKSAVLTQTH